ncbi:MAG: hypothetical protein LBG44_05840 [Gemmatimonadota bacterium]|jgi:hypothetical protein|nr:hypothetical protein [Gemmatimonadota bacterium]
MTTTGFPENELRVLYLEWCSAQVARRFLELTHDEVWERSRSAAQSDGEGGVPGYLELVRRTTLLLAREMNLPGFEQWKTGYTADPDAFVGVWFEYQGESSRLPESGAGSI